SNNTASDEFDEILDEVEEHTGPWRNGRRSGLKIRRPDKGRVGSTPTGPITSPRPSPPVPPPLMPSAIFAPSPRRTRVLNPQHQFPHRPPRLQQPVRLRRLRQRERGMNNRPDLPALQQRPHPRLQFTRNGPLLLRAPRTQRRARDRQVLPKNGAKVQLPPRAADQADLHETPP